MKKRKKKKILTEEQKKEQLKKREEANFRRKIRNIFINAGFQYLNTNGIHIIFANRDIEIDAVFLYENILLICEDTCATSHITDHIRRKKEAFEEIHNNFSSFLKWLCNTFPEITEKISKYDEKRYQVFNLYFSHSKWDITENEKKSRFPNIIFVEPLTLNYFHRMCQCIKLSSRYEIFRFLGLKKAQIGMISNEDTNKSINAPIIYPKDITGLHNGVRIVSFMMAAESLLSTCYVMRKDNWEDDIWLYQRLIDKEKIKRIRNFLNEKGEAFYNNIIVGLSDDVRLLDKSNRTHTVFEVNDFEDCKLMIPNEMNSICVIDGQHRIFAHYEGSESDKYEKKISQLRQKLHLLVTGLIFPEDMSQTERARIQSEIFLDINSNSKPVQADVLLHIEMIKNSFSDIGLARRIIKKLNENSIFRNMFELSSLEGTKIKVASIIKFALRYLVTMTPLEGKDSLFTYWDGNKEALLKKDDQALEEYTNFCVNKLNTYFLALKNNFNKDWNDPNSKILSVISLNGFIIAYNRQLKNNGIKELSFYDESLKKLSIDFSEDGFKYTSSQYRKFSDQIISEAFGLDISKT